MSHVVVLVLGDLGRSPRMQYHASSISNVEGVKLVTQIGYEGETVMKQAAKIEEIRILPWNFESYRRIALLHAGWNETQFLIRKCHQLSFV